LRTHLGIMHGSLLWAMIELASTHHETVRAPMMQEMRMETTRMLWGTAVREESKEAEV
jgi:hypothetical protein